MNTGCGGHHFELCVHGLDDVLQIGPAVGVLRPRVDVRVEGEVGGEVLKVLCRVRKVAAKLLVHANGGFVGPAPGMERRSLICADS